MSRLPEPGGDDGRWGDILNDFLAVAHMDDGTIRVEALPERPIPDGSITPSKLSQAYLPTASKGWPNGVASLDSNGRIPINQIPESTIVTDATTASKGVIQLAGDLSGTADAPTIPALNSKYVKPASGIPEKDLSSDVQTKLNTGGSIGEATSTQKGILQLTGDLAGTADSPTVPGLFNKIDKSSLGVAGGVATLGDDGLVNPAQMPSDDTKAADDNVVHLDGAETITGLKVFTSAPEVPQPEDPNDVANKQYVDDLLAGQQAPHIQPFSSSGLLMVEGGTHRLYNDTADPWLITSVRTSVGVAPTGASIIVDLNINGSLGSVFADKTKQPTIPDGGYTSGKVTVFAVNTVAPGQYLTVDIDQVGATTPGSDLTVQVEVR